MRAASVSARCTARFHVKSRRVLFYGKAITLSRVLLSSSGGGWFLDPLRFRTARLAHQARVILCVCSAQQWVKVTKNIGEHVTLFLSVLTWC